MAETVYVLCALSSLACAWLLLRGWRRSRSRLLLWSSVCFAGLALNNTLLVVDKVLTTPDVDLSTYRMVTAAVSVCVMLFGLIWDGE